MSTIGQPERATQNRVVALFRDELKYRCLGDWTDRDGNSNIEETLLSAWLTKSGYTPAKISRALFKLRTEADNPNRSLAVRHLAIAFVRQFPRRAVELIDCNPLLGSDRDVNKRLAARQTSKDKQ
jgi:hypothetical protein